MRPVECDSPRDERNGAHPQQELSQDWARRLLRDAAHALTTAGDRSSDFSLKMDLRWTELTAADSVDGVAQVLVQLLEDTRDAAISSLAIARQLHSHARQIEALAQTLDEARAEALLDPLCGLQNRRGFERAVAELFTAQSTQGVAVLLADVDHFKQLNDEYGHLIGDKVLRIIGWTLQSKMRGGDLVARLGGDEFSVLLPQTTLHRAQALAERIRKAVASERITCPDGGGLRSPVTVSIGVAFGKVVDGFEAILTRADVALYQAKRLGRNHVCLAPPE